MCVCVCVNSFLGFQIIIPIVWNVQKVMHKVFVLDGNCWEIVFVFKLLKHFVVFYWIVSSPTVLSQNKTIFPYCRCFLQ